MKKNTSILVLVVLISATASVSQQKIKPVVFKGHGDEVLSVAISSNGRFVLSGSADHTMKLWDIVTGRVVRTFKGHQGSIRTVVFTPDDKYALSGSEDGILKLWELSTGREIRSFIGHRGIVNSIAVTPDGMYVISGGANDKYFIQKEKDWERLILENNNLLLWEISTGKLIDSFRVTTHTIKAVALTPDGRFLLSLDSFKHLILWDMESRNQINILAVNQYPPPHTPISIALSPDGKYAISGGDRWDNYIHFWDIVTGKKVGYFSRSAGCEVVKTEDKSGEKADSYFSGLELLKGISLADSVYWSQSSGNRSYNYGVNSVAFTPDGKYFVSGSEDIQLWEIETGRCVKLFRGHESGITTVAVTPDGKYIVSGSIDNTMRLWKID